jgi:hypothetical protein
MEKYLLPLTKMTLLLFPGFGLIREQVKDTALFALAAQICKYKLR